MFSNVDENYPHEVLLYPSGDKRAEEKPERRFKPTLSDLVDRLTIAQQKAIFISEKKDAYISEMHDIMHDIDIILAEKAMQGKYISAHEIRAICVIMLTNRFIWENESAIRRGGTNLTDSQKLIFYRKLVATHSINGVRNMAKNELAAMDGGRLDYKIDCFAAELVEEFGNWDVFTP